MLAALQINRDFDIAVIGGGSTGLGIALDAATRGFSVVLIEQSDFAKGTSSKSTKLVHGGVRYLAQGNISLVYGALHERGILLGNAPHLVQKQPFVIPCYSAWDVFKYSAGLRFYDLLAGEYSFGRSRFISARAARESFPELKAEGLKGAVEYYDGQFDDARLAVNIAKTACDHGAVMLTYCKAESLIKENGIVTGVSAFDLIKENRIAINARVVVNATGVFVDDILKMDDDKAARLVTPSQGIHIVIDRKFWKGAQALMIPRTSDGRVLFAVPWHEQLLVGTTDTPVAKASIEPLPLEEEIDFILDTLSGYLNTAVTRADVLSMFAGLRPLAIPSAKKTARATREISRDHRLILHKSGLITITGGKWTTYRKMAEQTVDLAIKQAKFEKVEARTKKISIQGSLVRIRKPYPQAIQDLKHLNFYGSDGELIKEMLAADDKLARVIVEGHPYTYAEVLWAVRHEMAQTIEDVLSRRMRLLILDARAAVSAAPVVVDILAKELRKSEDWKRSQLEEFAKLADSYLPAK